MGSTNTRDMDLLLSANACLEKQWYRTLIPCTALQISRNYRLLETCTSIPELITDYHLKAKAWFSVYEHRFYQIKRIV